jgi:hypothetical protein
VSLVAAGTSNGESAFLGAAQLCQAGVRAEAATALGGQASGGWGKYGASLSIFKPRNDVWIFFGPVKPSTDSTGNRSGTGFQRGAGTVTLQLFISSTR